MNSQDYNALEDYQDLGKKRNKKHHLTKPKTLIIRNPAKLTLRPQLVVSTLVSGFKFILSLFKSL